MAAAQYSNLSRDEIYLISRAEFEGVRLITSSFARRLFKNPKKAADVLYRLTRKKRMIQLQRGKYLPVPIKAPNQQWAPNEFLVAGYWMGEIPYYIGFYPMYNYWGFTEQIPQTIFILNLRKNDNKTISNVRYQALKIDRRRYFGIQKIQIENEEVFISDKERTLVDFIYHPIGSYKNVRAVAKDNMEKISLKKFIGYLCRFPVVSVRKRAGFILQEIGCKNRILDKLKKSIGNKNTYVVLDPANKTRKGKICKEWKVIING